MFFFSSRRRHTRWPRDWSSDVCSSDLGSSADKQTGLADQLPDDAPARSTHSKANSNFATTARCARKHEKTDVYRGDHRNENAGRQKQVNLRQRFAKIGRAHV